MASTHDVNAVAEGSAGLLLDAGSHRSPLSQNLSHPLVTTRVGLVFVAITVAMLVCAFASQTVAQNSSLLPLLWIAALASCAIGGLIAMNSVRALRTVESELRRCGRQRGRWQEARPIVGRDLTSIGWNGMLHEIGRQRASDNSERHHAPLDQEVITLARAMRGLPVAWIITDGDGIIRFLSPAACGLLSLDEAETQRGKDLIDLISLREEEPDDDRRGRLLGPIRMIHERHTLRIDGKPVHLRIARSRLAGRTGDGEGMAWVLTDVTQQRLATEARDEFLMTATHELRTPLNNLQAYAEALQEEDDLEIEKQKEFCNVINSEAIRLGRLVDQLLTVSQMEAGSMIANRHELEMLPMLEQTVDQIRGQAEQKRMALQTNLSAKLPTVFGDRDKLQAALVNLVGNAVKYTPEQGEVSVRCTSDEQWIRIDVEDNGPGIPEDEQERVFDKFYRGAATESSEHRGNGLGLAFAREIARLHGGDIELRSEEGVGSVFTLRLPVGGRSRSGI